MSHKNPGGITENSPGSRRDSADHPGLDVLLNPHPERRARSAGRAAYARTFCDPLPGSGPLVPAIPRVFVAHAPRPGAKFYHPSGMEKV